MMPRDVAPDLVVRDAIPSVDDEALRRWIDSLSPETHLSDAMDDESREILLAFAERMASLTLRTRADRDLYYGLVAVGLAIDADPRETLTAVALLSDAAKVACLSIQTVASRAAVIANDRIRRLVDQFQERPPAFQDISKFYYCRSQASDGVRYAWCPPSGIPRSEEDVLI